jgi:hypothetical protein
LLTADQLHPVPEFPSSIGSDHLLALEDLDSRMLIRPDFEKFMTSGDMGLTAEPAHLKANNHE